MDDLSITSFFQERDLLIELLLLGLLLIWRLLHKASKFKALDTQNRWTFALIDFALFLVGAYAAGQILNWLANALGHTDGLQTAGLIAQLLLYIAVATGVGRLVEVWTLSRNQPEQKRHVSQLSRTLLYGTCWALAVIAFLNTNGLFPRELWLSTGAAAALIAFAMQQTLGDFFSGIALSMERPFRIGDWLRFSDGTEGEVTDINWRATRLRGWDNTTYVVPNSQLSREKFTNLHGQAHRYAPWYLINISSDADPALVKELLENAARRCDSILKTPPPVARLMDGRTMPFTYMVWVHFANYPAMFVGREDLYREINAALREVGLEAAANVQEVRHQPVAMPAQDKP